MTITSKFESLKFRISNSISVAIVSKLTASVLHSQMVSNYQVPIVS